MSSCKGVPNDVSRRGVERLDGWQVDFGSGHNGADQRLVMRAYQLAVQRLVQPNGPEVGLILRYLQDADQGVLHSAARLFRDRLLQRPLLLGNSRVSVNRCHHLLEADVGKHINKHRLVADHLLLTSLVHPFAVSLGFGH